VLIAWDDGEGERASLAEAIERLRQATAKPDAPRAASGPRPPRAGTKQAAVLAPMLFTLDGQGRSLPAR
jgi:hypothetical protein